MEDVKVTTEQHNILNNSDPYNDNLTQKEINDIIEDINYVNATKNNENIYYRKSTVELTDKQTAILMGRYLVYECLLLKMARNIVSPKKEKIDYNKIAEELGDKI